VISAEVHIILCSIGGTRHTRRISVIKFTQVERLRSLHGFCIRLKQTEMKIWVVEVDGYAMGFGLCTTTFSRQTENRKRSINKNNAQYSKNDRRSYYVYCFDRFFSYSMYVGSLLEINRLCL